MLSLTFFNLAKYSLFIFEFSIQFSLTPKIVFLVSVLFGRDDSATDTASSIAVRRSSELVESIVEWRYSSFSPITLTFPSNSSKITALILSSLRRSARK